MNWCNDKIWINMSRLGEKTGFYLKNCYGKCDPSYFTMLSRSQLFSWCCRHWWYSKGTAGMLCAMQSTGYSCCLGNFASQLKARSGGLKNLLSFPIGS